MNNVRERVAEILISLECVQLSPTNPFTYASGLKGPIYCDNRRVLSHVSERGEILNNMLRCIVHSGINYDIIGGVATAGIPLATLVAHQLGQPLCYVRAKAKEHGKKELIEGDLRQKSDIILIEDLVNQGNSIAQAIEGVRAAGHTVTAVFSIVDYEMEGARQKLKDLQIPLYSLVTFTEILKYGLRHGVLTESDVELLNDWKQDPANWKVN